MDKATAITTASSRLETLLKSQPNLMSYNLAGAHKGKDAAEFCITFIETYANWLEQQQQPAA